MTSDRDCQTGIPCMSRWATCLEGRLTWHRGLRFMTLWGRVWRGCQQARRYSSSASPHREYTRVWVCLTRNFIMRWQNTPVEVLNISKNSRDCTGRAWMHIGGFCGLLLRIVGFSSESIHHVADFPHLIERQFYTMWQLLWVRTVLKWGLFRCYLMYRVLESTVL